MLAVAAYFKKSAQLFWQPRVKPEANSSAAIVADSEAVAQEQAASVELIAGEGQFSDPGRYSELMEVVTS